MLTLATITATSSILGQSAPAFTLGLLLAVSEYLGTNTKLKSNSILQVIIYALRAVKNRA